MTQRYILENEVSSCSLLWLVTMMQFRENASAVRVALQEGSASWLNGFYLNFGHTSPHLLSSQLSKENKRKARRREKPRDRNRIGEPVCSLPISISRHLNFHFCFTVSCETENNTMDLILFMPLIIQSGHAFLSLAKREVTTEKRLLRRKVMYSTSGVYWARTF